MSQGEVECIEGQEVSGCQLEPSTGDDADCDGLDDDCDGHVDEIYLGADVQCGQGVCLVETRLICSDGEEQNTCTPTAPTGDDLECNGLDEDCDGNADEGFTPAESTCGTGVCRNTGISSCLDHIYASNCVEFAPTGDDSSCEGLDNDCDGNTDESYVPIQDQLFSFV